MSSTEAPQDLSALWRNTAHRATDAQLIACVILGLLASGGVGIAMLVGIDNAFEWWPAVLPCVLVAAFGLWGITDRELGERANAGAAPRVLAAARWCSAAVAALVLIVGALEFLRLTIGTWIS
jgi:hypothetical protein